VAELPWKDLRLDPFHRTADSLAAVRTFLSLIVLCFALTSAGYADLEIKKAKFGRDTGARDVRGIVEAYVRNGQLSFRVTSSSMGGDINPRQPDYLYIVYRANGQEYSDSVEEGRVFTFKGVGAKAIAPTLGIIPPAAPRVGSLHLTNDLGRTVLVYAVDRQGSWVWQQELRAGEALRTEAAVGQQWKVTSRKNEPLASFVIKAGRNVVNVEGDEITPPAAPARLSFENDHGTPLYVYKIDRFGAWNWVAKLESGGSYGANSQIGEQWIVTDTRGRILREVRVNAQTRAIQIQR
jgi:hypothetical protein